MGTGLIARLSHMSNPWLDRPKRVGRALVKHRPEFWQALPRPMVVSPLPAASLSRSLLWLGHAALGASNDKRPPRWSCACLPREACRPLEQFDPLPPSSSHKAVIESSLSHHRSAIKIAISITNLAGFLQNWIFTIKIKLQKSYALYGLQKLI